MRYYASRWSGVASSGSTLQLEHFGFESLLRTDRHLQVRRGRRNAGLSNFADIVTNCRADRRCRLDPCAGRKFARSINAPSSLREWLGVVAFVAAVWLANSLLRRYLTTSRVRHREAVDPVVAVIGGPESESIAADIAAADATRSDPSIRFPTFASAEPTSLHPTSICSTDRMASSSS